MTKSLNTPEFGRILTDARKAQGFKSQDHLDAFYRSFDHQQSCTVCSTIAGYMELSDGLQPYLGQCDEGAQLFRESTAKAEGK